MRQPTCVFVETVQIAEIADSALSALPGQGTGSFRVSRSSPVPPPHVPPERSVPCRFAWPLPGGRAVILFKANEKSGTTQRKQNASDVRSHRPRARSPSRARACPHVDLSRRSQFHARDSRDRGRAGSRLERRDPPPGGRGRGRCAVPPDHTPAGPPGPARAAIGPASARRSARVESPYVDVVRVRS